MTGPLTTDVSTAASQVREIRQLYDRLHQEFAEDGQIDPEEAALLQEVEHMLDQAEALVAGAGHTESVNSGSPLPDGAEPAPAQAAISGSVGQSAQNAPQDVTTVQNLLNTSGASPALETDGQSGPKTVRAIAAFQQARLGFADGRVDVGGQTWAALSGAASGPAANAGAAMPAPSGMEGIAQTTANTSNPDAAGAGPSEDNREPAETPDSGSMPLFQETFVTAGPFTFKNQFDANGKLVGCEAEEVVGGLSISVPLGLYTLSGGIQLLDVTTTVLNQEGPLVPVTMKVSLKGFGTVEFGVKVAKAIYELSLEGYTEARQILVNTEDPAASTSNVPNPTQIFIKGTGECKVSVGAGVESGTTVMKGEYDKLLIVTIREGPEIDVERGPGVDKFNDDFLAAIELAKKNPEIIGTGGTGGWRPGDPPEELEPGRDELEADAMRHVADDAQRIMVQAREQQLGESRAALETPNVVGGANSLNNRDPEQAARLYGALWQQRTDAIAAAAAYSPYQDGGPVSPEAKANEAEMLANRCDSVRGAFQAADAQWGYGQTTVWAETDDSAADTSTPGQPAEEEETIVDEILDFFGLDDDENKT